MKRLKGLITIFILVIFALPTSAQFTVDGQLLQRSEFRHGYGRLLNEREEPAFFISHRARIQTQYKIENFNFFVSVQDVRTWGNTPQSKITDNFLSVHEAWAETQIGLYFSLKLGRQELNYDNFRFLGNLDWAMQARAHDFALGKYEKENLKFHIGAGYNQDGENLSGKTFTIPNQYKIAQFARFENIFKNLNYSILFWNNGMQYSYNDPDNLKLEEGVYYMQTFGFPTIRYQAGNAILSGYYYHQLGRDVQGRQVNAFNASSQFTYLAYLNSERNNTLRITTGFEILSGTSLPGSEINNRSFSPLYGTNHMHNGYMDLFFVAGRYFNSIGLRDYFLRLKYDFNPNIFLSLNGHSFRAFADMQYDNSLLSKNFGTELDFTLGYIFTNVISLQGGYSQFFASDSFKTYHNFKNAKSVQNWAYVMLIYRPTMKNRFIGLLF
jgi:hypothetical protein